MAGLKAELLSSTAMDVCDYVIRECIAQQIEAYTWFMTNSKLALENAEKWLPDLSALEPTDG